MSGQFVFVRILQVMTYFQSAIKQKRAWSASTVSSHTHKPATTRAYIHHVNIRATCDHTRSCTNRDVASYDRRRSHLRTTDQVLVDAAGLAFQIRAPCCRFDVCSWLSDFTLPPCFVRMSFYFSQVTCAAAQLSAAALQHQLLVVARLSYDSNRLL